MHKEPRVIPFEKLIRKMPRARATVRGSARYPDLFGKVYFYDSAFGSVVVAEIHGLPKGEGGCAAPVFGFHIHSGGACTGNVDDPFANAGMHYNPNDCPHPHHAGDLPPLFGANGRAFCAVLSDRFTVDEIIGKTVVIHARPDDFTTQPAGGAGSRIACGVIVGYQRR